MTRECILPPVPVIFSKAEQARSIVLQLRAPSAHEAPPPYADSGPSSPGLFSEIRRTLAAGLGFRPDAMAVALCTAAEKGDLDRMEDLLKVGAAVDGTNEDGQTALRCAIAAGRRNAARFLVLHGASLASNSMTPPLLHVAARTGNAEMVRLLLDFGADPNARDLTGLGIFVEALRHKHLAVAQLLLERGADPLARDLTGRSALILAARHDDADLVTGLLARGASPNERDIAGQTLLSWAVQQRRVWLVRQLIACGADPNTRELSGRPVLATAVGTGEVDLVQPFVNYAANVAALDVDTRRRMERLLAPEPPAAGPSVSDEAPPAYESLRRTMPTDHKG